jgi:hypothetical protein
MTSIIELMKEMPEGYEEACYTEKAIQRKRGIDNPNDLMMLALFHLVNGCSLMEISEIARLAKLGSVSDVAFMKRFENCGSWFKWILTQLRTAEVLAYKKPQWLEGYEVLSFDASDVAEKGRSGRIYRLHYTLNLFRMQSAYSKITDQKTGESLCNFEFKKNDLIIADRMYSTLKGISHCMNGGANFILRLRKNSFHLFDKNDEKINLIERLKGLGDEETLDLSVFVLLDGTEKTQLRICAIRKDGKYQQQTEKALRRRETKKQIEITADTREFNNYIVVVTALSGNITGEDIVGLYRLRWQVEIYFKRLKSIMDFGELPKRRHKSAETWLNGKLLIALLIEKLMSKNFSPNEKKPEQEYLARN